MATQIVLATDGKVSFAILLYKNLTILNLIDGFIPVEVGFNAGDQERYASIPVTALQEVNVYRIDGEYILFKSCKEICERWCSMT